MVTRIGCGGFDIDNTTLVEEDGVLKVKDGGGGAVILHVEIDAETGVAYLNKTAGEILDLMRAGTVICVDLVESEDPTDFIEYLALMQKVEISKMDDSETYYFDADVGTYTANSLTEYPKS